MRKKIRNSNYQTFTPHLVAFIVLLSVIGVASVLEDKYSTNATGTESLTGDVVSAQMVDTYGKDRYVRQRYTNVNERPKNTGEGCSACQKLTVKERGSADIVTCHGQYQIRVPLIEDTTETQVGKAYFNVNGEVFSLPQGDIYSLFDSARVKLVEVRGKGIESQATFSIGNVISSSRLNEKEAVDLATCKGKYHVVVDSVNYEPFKQAILLVNNKQYVVHEGDKIQVDNGAVLDVVYIEKDKTKPIGVVGFDLE